jgi:hypothetical protein
MFNFTAIDRVWSASKGRFNLLCAPRLIIAYYDANRQLSLAARYGTNSWRYHRLPVWTGWDSHNHINMGVDSTGSLHLAANMHGDPLVYFKATGDDIRTLQRVPTLKNASREQKVTYPGFVKDQSGRLIFKYRDGSSGAGNEIYLAYQNGAWTEVHSGPLVDGEGQRNAYFDGPILGPDGYFHLCWVWREAPDAAANHSLSYAKSLDLHNWVRSSGTTLQLPMRLSTSEVVDPFPVNSGVLNGNVRLGFDGSGRPVITYFKFGPDGNTQVYLARRNTGGWQIAKVTSWTDFRWDFGGGGTLPELRLTVTPVKPISGSRLRIEVRKDGSELDLIVDANTLQLIEILPAVRLSDFFTIQKGCPAGMEVQTMLESWSGAANPLGIAWASQPPNRDQPAEVITDPTTLYLAIPSGS